MGSWLTETLVRQGWAVRALYRYNSSDSRGWLDDLPRDAAREVEPLAGDVRDPFQVRAAVRGMDAVFHLAALIGIPYSYHAPASYVATNISGTLNVLQACLEEGVGRVIHTSTSETYGSAQYTPIDEDHPLVGQSPYSASKIGADKLAQSYHLSFGLPVVTVRPFNVFGPRQSARAVIPAIIAQVLAGRDEVRLGSLFPVRDLTFAADTAAGFAAAAACDQAVGQTVNLGRGSGVTVGELAQTILDVLGSTARIVTDQARIRPEASEVRELICDNARADRLLGWRPRVGLREGLAATAQWMQAHLDRYRPEVYAI